MVNDSLFKTFSQNLSLYKPEYQNVFLCPLQVSPKCQKLYSYEEIGLLNIAHTWQKSLGGRQWTLTCRECNSFIGNQLESHAGKYAEFLESWKYSFHMSYRGVEGSVGGNLRINSEGGMSKITFEQVDKMSDSRVRAKVSKLLEAGELPEMYVKAGERFERRRVSLSYLHFAYLYLFHEYGYEWFYNNFAHTIRYQLQHLEEQTFEIPWAFIEPDIPNIKSSSACHLLVKRPYSLRGLQIISPQLKYQKKRRTAVFFSLAQPNIHNSKISSVLPPDYFNGLEATLSFPTRSVNGQLDTQTGLLEQALLPIFSR